jgi:hypothetical protein
MVAGITRIHTKQMQFNFNHLIFTFLGTRKNDSILGDSKNYSTALNFFKNIILIYFCLSRIFEIEASEIQGSHNGACEDCCLMGLVKVY